MDPQDLDEADPNEIDSPIEYKAKKSAEVCGQCGGEIGEPVFFTTKNTRRWRVPACADCGRDYYLAVRLETKLKTVSPPGLDELTQILEPTHAEAECVSCGRTCILCRDRHKFEKSWLKYRGERRTFCSQRCRVRHNNQKRSEQLERERANTECQECSDIFTPDRSDAKYCSAACKQRAYRKRKKAET
jgi:hypothetical protein